MIKRHILPLIKHKLKHRSAVAILGPRQVGKTTLAHQLAKHQKSVYLDLQSSEDLFKLSDPLEFFLRHRDKLIILDEIQCVPDVFKVLRGVIDKNRRAGKKSAQFLILGSAGPELLKQFSESLAGRISYVELSGLHLLEVLKKSSPSLSVFNKLWLRGGFPDSYLAKTDLLSHEWRKDFIETYLQRDIPRLGFRIPAQKLKRFWTMLAHQQGQILNASVLSRSLETSSKTIKHYIDILEDLLLVRTLMPWHGNIKKRLVKSPKIYIRDSGVLHCLLTLSHFDQLLSHPVSGFSWEGFVMENILSALPSGTEACFYRTAVGAEIDLVLNFPGHKPWAIEIKKGLSPKVSPFFHAACKTIKAERKIVIYGGTDKFNIKKGTEAMGVTEFLKYLKNSTLKQNRRVGN